ncbi:hypothetical protein O181_002892 [Austropuccinia psidii MF-1]|uniref:Uncharacterized protein n=1 Tax=Austropuccinia psidii MF-1 TaxID=1389203 RepID=A0A9Q3BDB5_9BASI|nr:hypothetical protein [Austropuccinia psidii MF-1]
MTVRPISQQRLHVLYTVPLVFSLACILMIFGSLCGLVPWRQTSGAVLIVHRDFPTADQEERIDGTASFYFGLLGSCYRKASDQKLQCTSVSYPPDYNTTIAIGGEGINVAHLDISMPDLPPVFLTWLLISIIAIICQVLGALPIYAPQRFFRRRFQSEKLFSATLWILGIGWAFGFSAVLALACFAQGFGDEYNLFSIFFSYNKATMGRIFVPLTMALVIQVIVGIAVIVQIANAPSEEKDAFESSWQTHLRVTGP